MTTPETTAGADLLAELARVAPDITPPDADTVVGQLEMRLYLAGRRCRDLLTRAQAAEAERDELRVGITAEIHTANALQAELEQVKHWREREQESSQTEIHRLRVALEVMTRDRDWLDRHYKASVEEAVQLREELTQRDANPPTKWAYDQAVAAIEKHRIRADEAEAMLRAIGMVKPWKNEDGKEFVFVSDLVDVLFGGDNGR